MSSSVDQKTFPSGSRVVGAGAMTADNAADAGGASGALARGTAAAAGGVWMGTSVLAAGAQSARHHHTDQTTILCVITGTMWLVVEGPDGDEELTVEAGQIAVVPGGLVHREDNRGDVDCLCVVVRNSETPAVVNV
ncbi:cupin domain-containing protein [Mycolicibacterium sp. 050158]|uniref:cupin domain-containing protein n=1 Tax=Mycolicibacterium sp. 050158 TaxID=3090602 RepID=UPI00299DFFF3|nr:cupin domain-containing protein [Mycolicibacterium sp. 050158]MDX1888116.1 cupin domain-containing protein [Mycolicibacterium sp. 050158]